MLEDAQRAHRAGADVVVGYVEPHARPETQALLRGLEVVPPRQVAVGGATLGEMDLDAVLARRARIVLVDELAHTNLPGSPHTKRFEDVRAILRAGSDVWATLNVQHLESLNDQVAAVTHVRQRETLPDAFLSQETDEIVAIDLPPEELRERIRQGKVYPRERVEAALEGFFRVERLTSLREIALRETARLIEDRRVDSAGGPDSPVAPAVPSLGDRLLILAAGWPGDERVVRRGWRLARSLQCEAEVLHVPHGDAHSAERLAELERICDTLRIPLRVLPAPAGRGGLEQAVAAHARRSRVTHVLAGAARGRRPPWRPSILQAIMERLPWVDFIVIGDPSRAPGEGEGDG